MIKCRCIENEIVIKLNTGKLAVNLLHQLTHIIIIAEVVVSVRIAHLVETDGNVASHLNNNDNGSQQYHGIPAQPPFPVCCKNNCITNQKCSAQIEIYVNVIDVLRHEFLCQNIPAKNACHGGPYGVHSHLVDFPEGLICHADQYEADHKRIPERQLVREMESVPDEVQFINIKAQEQECQERQIYGLFPKPDRLVHNIKNNEHYHQKSAVNVRHPLPVCQLREGQKLIENVYYIIIKSPRVRHYRVDIVCVLHASVCRQQHYRSHCNGKQRAPYRLGSGHNASSSAAALDKNEIACRIVEQYENAHHYRYVVIAEDCECQRNAVKRRISALNYTLQSQHYQRQQEHCIHPHDAPVISHDEGTKCIERREGSSRHIVMLSCLFKVYAHECSGEPYLDKENYRNPFHNELCRTH